MTGNLEFPIDGHWVRTGIDITGFWLLGLLILVVGGLVLSRLTLDNISPTPVKTWSRSGVKERVIRDVYRLLIIFASLYFYISVPVLFVILIGSAIGVVYLWYLFISNTPRTSLLILVLPLAFSLTLFYSAIQVVLSVFISVILPVKWKVTGRPLPRAEAPEMWKLLDEVAARIGTRCINRIYLQPEANIAVTEQGMFLLRMLGLGKRCLLLGIGALPNMTQGEFRAILAHEYGHFAHRDTSGGGLAILVQQSLYEMALALKMEGMATWKNPAWLFISGFHFLYMSITLGASRAQEVLADRRAVLAYGSNDFVNGLNRVTRQQILFDFQINHEAENAVRENRPLRNLYTLPPLETKWEKEVTIRAERAARRNTSAFASHPGLPERIKMAKDLNAPASVEDNAQPVWDLLPAEQLQAEMMDYMQRKVQAKAASIRFRMTSQPNKKLERKS
jgi:Zn-dependent protease with chaperone function